MPVSLDESIRPLPIHLGTEPEKIGENIQKNIEEMEADGQKIALEAETEMAKPSQDEAVLSKESQAPEETKRVQAQMNRWSIEDSPLWLLLLNWDPLLGSGSIEEKLQKLMELYQALLVEVLANTAGSNQQQQLVLLESALSVALSRYFEASLKELGTFFESYGNSNQLEQMKSELYRAITGHRLNPKDMKEFWSKGAARNQARAYSGHETAGSQMKAMNLKGGEKWNRYTSAPSETVIYQPGKKPIVIPAETLSTSHPTGKTVNKGISQNMTPAKGEISVRDMKLSKQFVTYVESEKNPFVLGTREFGGKSEELKGVLASLLQIQCREFSGGAKIGDTMSHILLDGIDRYIDKEIRREEDEVNHQNRQQSQSTVQSQSQVPPQIQVQAQTHPRQFRYNNVYKIYCHILGLYEKYRQPERAISEGIRYAVETYQQRSIDETDSKDGELRFFKVENPGRQLTFWSDLRAAKILLEQNWGHFMAYTVYSGKMGRQAINLIPLDRSFWGMCIKPETADIPMFDKHYLYLFMGVLAFGLILLFFLKL